MKKLYFTREGLEKIKQEYESLQQQRPDALEHLKKARELGDLSENGYYKASRAKLSFIDGRLFRLKNVLKEAVVIEATEAGFVSLGCLVVLDSGEEIKEFRIVGRYEANPAEGKISDVSPIGKQLLGKKIGDTVLVNAPAGTISYTIKEIAI